MKKAMIPALIAVLTLASTSWANVTIEDFDDDDPDPDTPVTYYVIGTTTEWDYDASAVPGIYGDFTDPDTGGSARAQITGSGGSIDDFWQGLGTSGGWNEGESMYVEFDADVKLMSFFCDKADGDIFNVSSTDSDVTSESFVGNGPHAFTGNPVLDANTPVNIEIDPSTSAAVFMGMTVEILADLLDGDYNDDAFVGQGDLDLVLLNWGDTGGAPEGWVNDQPAAGDLIGQGYLDKVLLNWGEGTAPTSSVPEPLTMTLLGLGGLGVLARRRRRS